MPEAALSATRLTKRFNGTTAVRGADVAARRGELFALLGPSGCGKTTTLRLLAGFERPDAGLVQIDGRTVVGPDVWVPPEQRRVGVVPQDFALFPHLNVGRNVAFGLERPGWGRRWLRSPPIPARAREMLELVGLSTFAERYPHELSGGEAQRVALARALAPAPAAVLLDEPFSNLDQNLRASLRLELREILRAADAAAIFVTHDREEALSLADRLAVMRDGRIEQIGAPDEVYHRPSNRFVASFVGNANMLEGERTVSGAATSIGALAIAGRGVESAIGAGLDILLRPEQLILQEAVGAAPERRGRIVSSEYYGHDQMVRVVLDCGPELEVRLHSARAWLPGDAVAIGISEAAIAFPRED